MNTQIEIKEMPSLQLIGCLHTGAYELIGEAYGKLMSWAGPKGLLASPNLKTVTVYHDDPKVTPIEKLRQSACITAVSKVGAEGEFVNLELPANRCVVGRFEISAEDFSQSWDAVCSWMQERGLVQAEPESYELYHNNHEEHPEKKFIVDICVPVA